MPDPCHPGTTGSCCGLQGSWLCSAPQHFTAALLPLHPRGMHSRYQEKLLLIHQGQTEVMQTQGNAAGRQREGWRRTQQPTLNLQGKTKSPPSSKSTLALPGSQSHPQQYSREPHSAALQAINSNIRIKKEVPDRARFSDRQAGSQQHKHTEHGQTSALPPPPPHPCFLFIPIFSFFFSSHSLWLLSEGDLHHFAHGVFVSSL